MLLRIISETGLGLSTLFLILSLAVLTSFPSLRCCRNRIHMNLFLSMALNNITWLLWYVLVLFNSSVWSQNPVWCRVLHVVTTYFMLSTYSWMMCEGAFLWLLTTNTVLEEALWVRRLTLLGWLSPLLALVPYTAYRHFYENELCWMDHDRSMLFLALPVISVILITDHRHREPLAPSQEQVRGQWNGQYSIQAPTDLAKRALTLQCSLYVQS